MFIGEPRGSNTSRVSNRSRGVWYYCSNRSRGLLLEEIRYRSLWMLGFHLQQQNKPT